MFKQPPPQGAGDPASPADTQDRRGPVASQQGQAAAFKWELLLVQHSASICQAPFTCSLHKEYSSKRHRRPPRKPRGTAQEARGTVRKRLSQEPVAVRIIPSLLQVTKQDQQLHVTWPHSAHLWVPRLNPSPLWASGFQSLDKDP